MIALAGTALLIGAFAVSVPMAIWSVECLLALLPPRSPRSPANGPRPGIAVLVPAHDEAAGIAETLASLSQQMLPGDRIVVIADNCGDATADIARRSGALVLERRDDILKGKSYALDFAVKRLQQDAPDVYLVIDADCVCHPGAIDQLARLAVSTGRPVQGDYRLEMPFPARPHQPIVALAFRISNFVRPSGLDRLGLPCFLNGTGMAFPAAVLADCHLANGKMAEDKWLTVDLILAGHPALFCPDAIVTSRMPAQRRAEVSQSTRWLHGRLECMQTQGPRLLRGALRQRRWDLLGLWCDLLVPPLSLLTMLWVAVLAISIAAGLCGLGWLPVRVAAIAGTLILVSFCGVLVRFGGKGILRALWAVPFYIAARLPIYPAYAVRRKNVWVRTARDPAPPPE